MNDPTEIERRYRQFAEVECKGYSEAYYRLALAVSEEDEVIAFLPWPPRWMRVAFSSVVRTSRMGSDETGSLPSHIRMEPSSCGP